MSRFLRAAMAWLLFAALPIQAGAAHAMLFCAPAHHHHQAQTLCDLAEVSPDQGHEDSAAGSCSVCAACSCCGGAIAVTVLQIELLSALAVGVPHIPTAHERVLIGGLERPPRTPGA